MRTFNTTGTCRPNEHYMVDITERLEIIRKMVAKGDYFCINRGRQYGKTTTLEALAGKLAPEYTVFKLSFEGASPESFASLPIASAYFLKWLLFNVRLGLTVLDDAALQILENAIGAKDSIADLDFAYTIPMLCKANSKPIVILIDEVDQASNYEPFLLFLGVLRRMFLNRASLPTFQSVILAGVYDIKNLKLKMHSEDEHQHNSPWNIAVPFNVEMSLSAKGIADMLAEYKADCNLKFDEVFVGQMIRDYTAGYPFLVSRICQIIDSEQYSWNKDGVLKAVNFFVNSEEEFCIDIRRNLTEDINLYKLLEEVTKGQYVCYMPYGNGIKKALEYDYIKRMKTPVEIASKIHEDYLVSFCFNKGKQSGLLPPVELNGRTLIEAIV